MFRSFRRIILRKFFRDIEESDITMEELLKKQLYGAEIVDVRSKQEYDESHIEGAINIPEYEINSNVVNILKDKNREIVVCCGSGSRSKKAYKKLLKLKYKKVFNLYGGLDNWE